MKRVCTFAMGGNQCDGAVRGQPTPMCPDDCEFLTRTFVAEVIEGDRVMGQIPEEREAYLVLMELAEDILLGWPSLCQWCVHAKWSGCGELYCQHPVDEVSEVAWDAWEGGDCQGFTPNIAREDAVDVVGIWLTGQFVDWASVPSLVCPGKGE